jgi:hypothetical protein
MAKDFDMDILLDGGPQRIISLWTGLGPLALREEVICRMVSAKSPPSLALIHLSHNLSLSSLNASIISHSRVTLRLAL